MRSLKCILATLMLFALSSCMSLRLHSLADKVEIMGLNSFEVKGLSALMISLDIDNQSKQDLSIEGAQIVVRIDGERVLTLTQRGVAHSPRVSRGAVASLWRMDSFNPLVVLQLSNRIAERDYAGISIDFQGELNAGRMSRDFSLENIALSRIFSIFANVQ